MANGKDQVDQSALAAEWGLSLDDNGGAKAGAAEGAGTGEGNEAAASNGLRPSPPSFGAGKAAPSVSSRRKSTASRLQRRRRLTQ